MSYDLLVFEPSAAPRDRDAFLAWWKEQSEWSENHGYDDVAVATPALQRWYDAMRKFYPPMNGPDAVDEHRIDEAADYCVGRSVIYVGFRWSDAETVYPLFRSLAVQHAVGFYDVSGDEGDGEIYFPGDTLRSESDGDWRRVSREFKDLSNQ